MPMRFLALAYEMAGAAHAGQRRRGNGEPYINHPIRVARMVAETGAEEELVIAAVLHDTVEDSDLTFSDIERNFGAAVRDLVDGCTDDPSIEKLPRKLRKTAQAEKFRTASLGKRLIKLADQTDNLESLLATLDTRRTEDARSYADCAMMVARACGGAHAGLLERAEWTCAQILDALSEREACPVP